MVSSGRACDWRRKPRRLNNPTAPAQLIDTIGFAGFAGLFPLPLWIRTVRTESNWVSLLLGSLPESRLRRKQETGAEENRRMPRAGGSDYRIRSAGCPGRAQTFRRTAWRG